MTLSHWLTLTRSRYSSTSSLRCATLPLVTRWPASTGRRPLWRFFYAGLLLVTAPMGTCVTARRPAVQYLAERWAGCRQLDLPESDWSPPACPRTRRYAHLFSDVLVVAVASANLRRTQPVSLIFRVVLLPACLMPCYMWNKKIISKLFRMLIAAHEYFLTCSLSLK